MDKKIFPALPGDPHHVTDERRFRRCYCGMPPAEISLSRSVERELLVPTGKGFLSVAIPTFPLRPAGELMLVLSVLFLANLVM